MYLLGGVCYSFRVIGFSLEWSASLFGMGYNKRMNWRESNHIKSVEANTRSILSQRLDEDTRVILQPYALRQVHLHSHSVCTNLPHYSLPPPKSHTSLPFPTTPRIDSNHHPFRYSTPTPLYSTHTTHSTSRIKERSDCVSRVWTNCIQILLLFSFRS